MSQILHLEMWHGSAAAVLRHRKLQTATYRDGCTSSYCTDSKEQDESAGGCFAENRTRPGVVLLLRAVLSIRFNLTQQTWRLLRPGCVWKKWLSWCVSKGRTLRRSNESAAAERATNRRNCSDCDNGPTLSDNDSALWESGQRKWWLWKAETVKSKQL